MYEKAILKIIKNAAKDGRSWLNLSWKGDFAYGKENRLKRVPPEIGFLCDLKILWLDGHGLKELPPEIGGLCSLEELRINNNRLTSLPPEIGKLKKLKKIDLRNNQLRSLPQEIGGLISLPTLDLEDNKLEELPASIGELINLRKLNLYGNDLTSLPAQIGKLTNLKYLYLSGNQLKSLSAQIGKLKNLIDLYLRDNQLTSLPKEIGQLKNLTRLSVSGNQLTSLPDEIGKLSNLSRFDLECNQIRRLPKGMGHLNESVWLDLEGNKLTSPPMHVVKQGNKAIFAYLREQSKASGRQWVSKMLVCGEGGVGKTSLLRALRGEEFVEGLETTHGIGVETLELKHPSESEVTMMINSWDFGGQQIYHATHQFFLTDRSVFLLVWDARHGWEAGKLYQWLDRIQAKAPESPVLIVAAHIDERDADLPLEDLRRRYGQIKGHYEVSNKEGTGIDELREAIAEAAAGLPLMGEEWPASWLDAANEIRARSEHYITPKELNRIIAKHKIEKKGIEVLTKWLHDLGDILYFKEDDELNDWVILKPQWITEAISEVLESSEVIKKDGIFTRRHMDELWGGVDEGIRGHFLRLMERFDLSYRTLENREISLVVERLPLDPPDYAERWEGIRSKEGCKEISMKFEVGSIPPGIPTWFIARSHRFTTHTHWRRGALFADDQKRHWGLVEAYPHDRYLQLTVRGPSPHNFFVLLRDGLELTFARYPGLEITRTIPCTGHEGEECNYEFDVRSLQKAIEKDNPVMEVQCQETLESVSVVELLFGLDWRTQESVIRRIGELEAVVVAGDKKILTELGELTALSQRGFTSLFNAAQGLAESHCPRVFTLRPVGDKWWGPLSEILKKKWELHFYCEAPGCWHMTDPRLGGRYYIDKPSKWLKSITPHLQRLIKVFKFVAPLAGPWLAYAAPVYEELLKTDIDLMKELVGKLPELTKDRDLIEESGLRSAEALDRTEGAQLRAVRRLLDEVDKNHEWGGLKKVLTPEGHYLWLCEAHAGEYVK